MRGGTNALSGFRICLQIDSKMCAYLIVTLFPPLM